MKPPRVLIWACPSFSTKPIEEVEPELEFEDTTGIVKHGMLETVALELKPPEDIIVPVMFPESVPTSANKLLAPT